MRYFTASTSSARAMKTCLPSLLHTPPPTAPTLTTSRASSPLSSWSTTTPPWRRRRWEPPPCRSTSPCRGTSLQTCSSFLSLQPPFLWAPLSCRWGPLCRVCRKEQFRIKAREQYLGLQGWSEETTIIINRRLESTSKRKNSVTHLLLGQMQACVMEGNFSGEMPQILF